MKRDGMKNGRLHRLLRRLGRFRLQRRAKAGGGRRHQDPDQRALCPHRHVGDGPGAQDVATKPDAVLLGGSATQGALPLLALAERGYKGPLYGTPALLNADFIRVGGKAVEGVQVSAGPVIVAEQLPDAHFSKKISMDFRAAYQKANGMATHGRLLGLFLRRLAGLRSMRRSAAMATGQARHAGVPRRPARTRCSPPRSSWARTPSTTSSPARATASTSAASCWCAW